MDSDRRQDLNHDDASRTCQHLNARLVSVDSDDEFELLKREIRQRVTATGQEFAHEQWWTSGRFVNQRWVWDKEGYPPGQLQHCLIPLILCHHHHHHYHYLFAHQTNTAYNVCLPNCPQHNSKTMIKLGRGIDLVIFCNWYGFGLKGQRSTLSLGLGL